MYRIGTRHFLSALQWRNLAAAGAAALVLGGCTQAEYDSLITGSIDPPGKTGSSASGKTALSLKTAKTAYRRNPGSAKKAVVYARILQAARQKRKAFAVLTQAAERNPGNRRLAMERGFAALELGQATRAETLLRKAINPRKPNWRVHSALGTALASRGKQQEAQIQFARALELKPDHPSILNNLALSYALDGKARRAKAMLEHAAAANPKSARVKQNLALLKRLQENRKAGPGAAEPARARAGKTIDQPRKSATYVRRLKDPLGRSSHKVLSTAKQLPAAARKAISSANYADPHK